MDVSSMLESVPVSSVSYCLRDCLRNCCRRASYGQYFVLSMRDRTSTIEHPNCYMGFDGTHQKVITGFFFTPHGTAPRKRWHPKFLYPISPIRLIAVFSSLCGAPAIKSATIANMVVAQELDPVEHSQLDRECARIHARGRGDSRPRGGLWSVGLHVCGRLFLPKEMTTKGSMSQPVRVTTTKTNQMSVSLWHVRDRDRERGWDAPFMISGRSVAPSI